MNHRLCSSSRLCFSTEQTWEDAQAICKSIGSNIVTIDSQEELDHLANTSYFSPVRDSWGLDWRCFWSGWTDAATEGEFRWISTEDHSFTPSFGPFEANNGAGDDEDCVAVCKQDCDNLKHLNGTEFGKKCVGEIAARFPGFTPNPNSSTNPTHLTNPNTSSLP